MKKTILLAFLFICYFQISFSQPGELDPSFGNNGIVHTNFPLTGFNNVAVQKDGKVVAAGYNILARFNTNGNIDSTFGKNGKDTARLFVGALAIQNDGKILIASGFGIGFVIERYNSDGDIDSSFGNVGKQVTPFGSDYVSSNSIAIQTDGKIIVSGMLYNPTVFTYDYAVVRYNIDGSLDNSFSDDGKITCGFSFNREDYKCSVAIQSDGKIVVAGANFTILRFNSNGSYDATFNAKVAKSVHYDENNVAYAIAIQKDGKIVIAGTYFDYAIFKDFTVVRLNTDGSLDNTFNGNGKQTTNLSKFGELLFSMVLQPDGKIVAGGLVADEIGLYSIGLARLNTNGSLDSTFGDGGKQITNIGNNSQVNAMAIFDNKLYAAGPNISGFIARYFLQDSKATTIKITNLIDNSTYIAPAAIDVSTYVIAAAGTSITKVQFYVNDKLVSTDNTKPYSYSWNNISAGNYTLTAKATDNTGATATSIVHVSVLAPKPPVVYLQTPKDNKVYLDPAAYIKLRAAATDSDGTITKVEFYNGTTLLHTETVIPYGYVWRNVPLGNYTITAKAYDSSGLITTSAPVHISVVPNKPPVVSITNPASNQTFADTAAFLIVANAADTDGRISRVEFYNGSTLLGTEYTRPYRYHWKNMPAGTYTITAVAVDDWSAKTTSTPITITITSTGARMISNRQNTENEKASPNDAFPVSLYPNPATSVVNIYTKGIVQNKPATVSVISALGVTMKTIQINSSTQTIPINVSSLAKGVYTIKITSGNKTFYKQFVKM